MYLQKQMTPGFQNISNHSETLQKKIPKRRVVKGRSEKLTNSKKTRTYFFCGGFERQVHLQHLYVVLYILKTKFSSKEQTYSKAASMASQGA